MLDGATPFPSPASSPPPPPLEGWGGGCESSYSNSWNFHPFHCLTVTERLSVTRLFHLAKVREAVVQGLPVRLVHEAGVCPRGQRVHATRSNETIIQIPEIKAYFPAGSIPQYLFQLTSKTFSSNWDGILRKETLEIQFELYTNRRGF